MLLDRGLLERDGDEYRRRRRRSTTLDVPETLQALIAARLDGLEPEERRVLEDASVLGKTFTHRGPRGAVGDPEDDARRRSSPALVRKEVLALESDPRSPERGQYGFLQALVQRVAYETLSRRDRKAKHLAAAEYLRAERGIEPDEIAEVIAAHYLDAFRADRTRRTRRDRGEAREWLDAGRRARGGARGDTGRAARVRPGGRARRRARSSGRRCSSARATAPRTATSAIALERLLREARASSRAARAMTHDAARAAAGMSRALWNLGRHRGGDRAASSRRSQVLAADEPDADVADARRPARRASTTSAATPSVALERVEFALDDRRGAADLPEVLSAGAQHQGAHAALGTAPRGAGAAA